MSCIISLRIFFAPLLILKFLFYFKHKVRQIHYGSLELLNEAITEQ